MLPLWPSVCIRFFGRSADSGIVVYGMDYCGMGGTCMMRGRRCLLLIRLLELLWPTHGFELVFGRLEIQMSAEAGDDDGAAIPIESRVVDKGELCCHIQTTAHVRGVVRLAYTLSPVG
jgi:hypothetical protein